MNQTHELWIKSILSLIALGALVWDRRQRMKQLPSPPTWLFPAIALVCFLAYYNFGAFHKGGYVHYWENYHYHLNSKYFSELGYEGLYVASLEAQKETSPQDPLPEWTRDLRTNRIVATASLAEHQKEVFGRFKPQRWQSFVKDHEIFLKRKALQFFRRDHGFNGTPTWTFVGQIFTTHLPTTPLVLVFLSSLDVVLLILMFATIFWAYGLHAVSLSLIIFGLGYPGRFYWVGGAFLRQDWLAASVIGICMLKKNRNRTAGLLFGYATMSRLFPVLFLLGPAVLAIKTLVARENPDWIKRLALGFFISVILGFTAGGFTGRGFQVWQEFSTNMQRHHDTWLANNVGLENLLLYGPDTFAGRLIDAKLPDPRLPWRSRMGQLKHHNRIWIALAQLTFLLLIVRGAWRTPRDEAATLGLAVIFCLALLTCYYWLMLLIIPLRRNIGAVIGLLVLNLGISIIHLLTNPEYAFQYGILSWALALYFLYWIIPKEPQSGDFLAKMLTGKTFYNDLQKF
jgi:hypothetical protein